MAIVLELRGWAPRGDHRCGLRALDFSDVRIGGECVTMPLCLTHFRKLRDSPDPAALATSWSAV